MTRGWDHEQLRLPLDLGLDFDTDEAPGDDAYPELPPRWHLIHYRGQLRLTRDLPDIANYEPTA